MRATGTPGLRDGRLCEAVLAVRSITTRSKRLPATRRHEAGRPSERLAAAAEFRMTKRNTAPDARAEAVANIETALECVCAAQQARR
jgi:hypothetical protein